ncbi:MAG: peptidylprolyl isomerase [Actinomycetota bacterium]|nr:peptidylprolyl isomerase [Actinomycetota bacterium]
MILLAGVIGLAGCGSSSATSHTSAGASATSAGPSTSAATSAGGCRPVPSPAPKPAEEHLSAPTLRLDPAKTYTVTVATSCGTFAFSLDVRDSPKTSASVYALVERGFYDGLSFQRVAAGFVIQGGDPAGDGSGGPGYTVVEPPSRSTQYVRGDVAMAKTQVEPSGASGSQFFVVTAANVTQSAGLTPDYALVGKVVSGQSVVDKIGALPTNPAGDGVPTPPVVMSRVTVAPT